MAAKHVEIAAEIVTALNAAVADDPSPLSQTFEAARAYRPKYKLEDLGTLHVVVVPRSHESAVDTRATEAHEYAVDVGVLRRFEGPPTNAECDALMLLVDEIAGVLRFTTGATSGAAWVGSTNEPVYAADHLDDWHQFTSVLTTRWRWSG